MAIWLTVLQAATAWSMPAEAHWDGAAPPISVRVASPTVSMRGNAPIAVEIVAEHGGFAISRFVQVTTGIALDVRSLGGEEVQPLEPIIGSPPPPPMMEGNHLTAVTPNAPFRVLTAERSRTLFPAPGIYRVSAVVVVFDGTKRPERRAQIRSEPITVHVTP